MVVLPRGWDTVVGRGSNAGTTGILPSIERGRSRGASKSRINVPGLTLFSATLTATSSPSRSWSALRGCHIVDSTIETSFRAYWDVDVDFTVVGDVDVRFAAAGTGDGGRGGYSSPFLLSGGTDVVSTHFQGLIGPSLAFGVTVDCAGTYSYTAVVTGRLVQKA